MDMPSPEIKQLWIRVLKRVHPDLAIDEQDRIRCERLTKLANEAYQRATWFFREQFSRLLRTTFVPLNAYFL